MSKFIDLTGKKFERLTVLKFDKKVIQGKGRSYYWLCQCECGNIKSIKSTHLKSGKIKSCGCLQKEIAKNLCTTHNLSNSKLFKILDAMKGRCYNKNNKSYKYYGGRGIIICDEWKNNFKIFYDWAINNGYQEGLTIDRINVNGNYEPSNCRWITQKQQANNTRANVYITYNNQTHTLMEWSEITGISYSALRHRLQRKWTIEKTLTTPLKTYW